MQDAVTIDRAALDEPPLVVDLDGTLLKSDLLVEGFFALVAADPAKAARAIAAFWRGKANIKSRLAEEADIDVAHLPWNRALLALLQDERARGRRIYLASASDRRWVEAVAEHLGLFDGFFGSDGKVNLKGTAKAEALCQAFGERGFDYAGNEAADLAVWEQATRVIVVDPSPAFERRVRRRWPGATLIGSSGATIKDYGKAIRIHQWLKNLLVLVPVLAAHQLSVRTAIACVAAYLSFSLCASSVYILNDLIDLGRDRVHPTKRNRPLAQGAFPIRHGITLVPILLLGAVAFAAALPPAFLLVLAGYYGLTLAYSVYLKRRLMADVVALACLYGLRLVAGGVAVGVELSAWLTAFSIFFFCSLALVKRCTELAGRILKGSRNSTGRAYQSGDLPILEALAAASGYTAVLVLALYINGAAVQMLYTAPSRLWLLCVVLIYWIGRVLMLAHRGQMDDDPVVFAVTDRASLVSLVLVAVILSASL